MTTSEKLIKWLSEMPNVAFESRIETDRLKAIAESYALYKQPQKQVTTYVDGSAVCVEYFFLACRQTAQLESERPDNQEFMAMIEDWIWAKNDDGDLPTGIDEVLVTNSFHAFDQDENDTVYQIALSAEYRKDK